MDLTKLIFLKVFFIAIINAGTPAYCHMAAPGQNDSFEGDLSLKEYSLKNSKEPLKRTDSEEPVNSETVEVSASETFDVQFPDGNYLSKDGNELSGDTVVLSKSPDEAKEANDEDDAEAFMKSETTESTDSTTKSESLESDNLSDELSDRKLSEKISKQLFGEYSTEYADDFNKSQNENTKMDPDKEYYVKTVTPPNSLMVLTTPSGCSLLDYQDDDDNFNIAEFKFKVSDLEDCEKLTKDIMDTLQGQLANEIALSKTPQTKMVEISVRDPMRNRELNVKETTQVFTSGDRSGHSSSSEYESGDYSSSSTAKEASSGSDNVSGTDYRNSSSKTSARISKSNDSGDREFEGLFGRKYPGFNVETQEDQEALDMLSENLDLQFIPTSSDSVFVMSYSIRDVSLDELKREKLFDDFLTLLDSFSEVKNDDSTHKSTKKVSRSEKEGDSTKSSESYENVSSKDDVKSSRSDWFKRLQNLPTDMFEKFLDDAKKLLESEEGKKELEKLGKEFDKKLQETNEYIKKELSIGKQILEDLSKHGMDNVECSKLTNEECSNYSKCQVMEVNGKDICFVSPKTVYWLMGTNCGLQTRPALMSIARDLKNVGYLDDDIVNNLATSFDSNKICKVITHTYLSKLLPKQEKQPNNPFN